MPSRQRRFRAEAVVSFFTTTTDLRILIDMTIADPIRSRVSAVPPAGAPLAARHFAARLELETDPSDVWADLLAGTAEFVLIDARSPDAYRTGHLQGAVNLPHADIDEASVADLDRDRLHVTYCWSPACNAATRAAAQLATHGIRVKEMLGGIEYWHREGFPVEEA